MLFRVEYTLRDVGLAEGDTLELSEAAPPTSLVIRRPTKKEKTKLKEEECLGIVQTEEPITEKVRPQFEIQNPPRPAVKDIGKRITIRLHDFLMRGVSVLRWRVGSTAHPDPIVISQGLHWSDDSKDWKIVPGSVHLRLRIIDCNGPMCDDIRASVTELFGSGKREPLGHELFREAWSHRNHHPRSSLLIGISAAEVGFKEFIADLVPHAEWLAMRAPSPPLVAMLTDYLPKLPVRQQIEGVAPFVPKEMLNTFKNGVQLRNKTAHSGGDVKQDTLEKILRAVNDLLYLLDMYAGQAWALEHVSHDAREQIIAEIDNRNQPKKK